MGYEDGKSTILDASFLIILLWCITIISDLFYQYYEHTRWILTEEGILYSNIFGKVSLIPYKEIGEMVRKKKATIRKGCMYIPYKGGKIAIQLHSEMSEHEVIPVLNKQCDLELPEIHTFEEREVVRKGGMGTGLIKLGMIMFFIIFCLLQLYEINKNGEIKIYWDNNMWLLHGLLDLWIIAIGLVCRIVFYYPTWKFFRPYSCIKVR